MTRYGDVVARMSRFLFHKPPLVALDAMKLRKDVINLDHELEEFPCRFEERWHGCTLGEGGPMVTPFGDVKTEQNEGLFLPLKRVWGRRTETLPSAARRRATLAS
jgi:hypothetical protein